MKLDRYLYRGVNEDIYNKNEAFKQKGLSFLRLPEHGDEYASHGSGLVHGSSEINSILAHQTDSSKFPSSGISATPIFEIAKKYATYNKKKGYVFKIDTCRFKE
jgi:hypothetical protein